MVVCKLAFCITELNVGGAERIMSELAVQLARRNFSVTVYSLQPRPVGVSCVSQLESAAVPVRFLDMRGKLSFAPGLLRLQKLLKEESPDIFLSFMFHANFLGRLAAYFAGVKHVVSGIRVAERGAGWHLKLDKWTSGFVEKYICVSNSVAEFSKNVGGLSASKICVIPNGVVIPQSINESSRNRIIFVGRLDYQKGVDWLIRTLPDWLPRLSDWEFVIVGDGILRNEIESQVDDSLRRQVKFLGWRADVSDLIAESKLLLLTSRWEGMPNVLLQAMSEAKPVVATAVEGIFELLGNGVEEQTCEFGNSRQFAQKILNIANNQTRATQLGQENRQRIIDNFSLEKMVQEYEQLLLKINS
ncbi:MAG: glycosyltransferase [Planctomycetaceae bacterium]|nr:glycosyltransferase [Planctomycetaceae bacterium]